MKSNHVNQCTKLILHTLSQILDQNDNELIKNMSHILNQINNSNIYFMILHSPIQLLEVLK